MSKKLVIVESPGKIKKINEYLGSDYIVKASMGHCVDLDKSTLSIDIQDNFKPTYVICDGKHKIVSELKKFSKEYEVILASDEDREGEAIAWFLQDILKLKNPKRIVFHEITKKAILNAIENPRMIDMNMVHAQQARRLLDRLVGYKISPILWKHLKTDNNNTIQSAGRVQSVVVKIIVDKEDEIKKTLSEPYYKTSCILIDKNKTKINCNLESNSDNELYKFKSKEEGISFLQKINSKIIFTIIDIENKNSIRKPPPPFITSSLQQEASTKLKFGVQKTMQVAQKLYEAGLITYMRTDSTCLSKDAINGCKTYIKNTFGDNYSNPIQYNINKNNAQEAHEAIRPTHITMDVNIEKDELKLYTLIFKRTIASQMAPAQLNIQKIKIDSLDNNKSILSYINSIWISNSETIIFDGYLAIYNDNNDDEDNEKINNNSINEKQNLKFDSAKINQEYTKLPLRYNEANLVRYLEKNNIGRPSTYATIINKILERKYVEIKNIDGEKKESIQLLLTNKYDIKESINTITIGKENKKIVPTEMGLMVNNFMITNFEPIMQIDFTAEFEKYLDMIAEGKAKWYNVLDKFYKLFEPIIIKLTIQQIEQIPKTNDNLLGLHPTTNKEIYIGSGKYGNYIKYNNKYTSIENSNISLEDAILKLEYPKELGKYNKKLVYLCSGKFGFYFKYDNNNISFNQEDLNNVDIEYFKQIYESGDKNSLKTFKIKDLTINVKSGQYGPYLQLLNSKKKILKNISIPKNIKIENININDIINIIEG